MVHLGQRQVKIESAHPRHSDIQQNAINLAHVAGGEKNLRRIEGGAWDPAERRRLLIAPHTAASSSTTAINAPREAPIRHETIS